MDEVNYKLNTNNSVLVVSGMEKLISNIKMKFKPTEKQKFFLENEELMYLREKCSSEETLVSLTACQGLLALVEAGILDIGHTMSTLITMLSIAHNHSAIISAISGLLILDLKSRIREGKPYKCQYKMKYPQHPFITIIEKNTKSIPDVLQQMSALCTHPDYTISCNSIELLRPVLVWLSCVPSPVATAAVWPLLISLSDHEHQRELLLQCLAWQQIRKPEYLDRSLVAYSTVMDSGIYQKDSALVMALLPVLATISNELVNHGRDPRGCYILIGRGFDMEAPELRAAAGTTLMLLAENLTHTCAMYLQELFSLCLKILNKYEVPSVVVNVLIAYSLQWLNQPSCLTENALKIAAKIMALHEKTTYNDGKLNIPNLLANNTFKVLVNTDTNLILVVKILRTWERLQDNPVSLKSWLETIKNVDNNLQLKLVGLLLGITIGNDSDLTVEALQIVLNLVKVKKELSIQVLPVLLYKVANDNSADVKLEAMKGIPLMAIIKENVPSIVAILNKLKTSKCAPTSFLIYLYTTLAEIQVRCYPYLREILLDTTLNRHDDIKWEIDVAKAVAVKTMCQKRASSHGRELVSLISDTLNHCNDESTAICCANVLDALGILWTETVVGPPSTWRALEPKMGHDRRPKVQIALCNLLSRVPSLKVDMPDYDQLLSDTARKLWHYIAESDNADVIIAACHALAEYEVSDYKLSDIPEVYRRVVRLPPAYCKTPADADRRPEDVLDYVPCEIWPEVFKNTNQNGVEGIRHLVTQLIGREIKNYRSGVYCPENKTELANLSHLPTYSVLRGIVDYVKKQALHPTYECPESVLTLLLQVMSSKYCKSLPPIDVSYLPQLSARGQHLTQYCLVISARQASVTNSAKVLIQEFLTKLQADVIDDQAIDQFCTILPIICKTLETSTLKEPIEKCLSYTFMRLRETSDPESSMFVKVVESIRQTINGDIQPSSNTLLTECMEHYYNCISDTHLAWPYVVKCVCAFPADALAHLASPVGWWEVTPLAIRKTSDVADVRAAQGDLNWLIDVIEATATCPDEHESVKAMIRRTLQTRELKEYQWAWFIQLLTKIQCAWQVEGTCSSTEKAHEIEFLTSMVIVAAISLTGYHALEPQTVTLSSDLLPLALHDMFAERNNEWNKPMGQVIEWLLYIKNISACVCLRAHMTNTTTWAAAITKNLQ